MHDVLVIGSGPAGVCAAFPLVEAGLSVLMVDGGEAPDVALPRGDYLELRRHDPRQWEWMVGREFGALAGGATSSPKFRVPTLAYAFRGFAEANGVVADDFVPIGSLAVGGLSNAWGTGVARFSPRDLEHFPFAPEALTPSFDAVARRIGLSGAASDDLAAYCGVDEWADAPVPLDALHRSLDAGYARARSTLLTEGFRLGRARVAALTRDRGAGRGACTRSGLCLWGCAEGSLYSARNDVATLALHPNFTHRPHVVADRLLRSERGWTVQAAAASRDGGDGIAARTVVLAAGVLATTRIALRSLDEAGSVPLLSQPFAAFALWLPAHLGAARESAAGFAQLAFALDADGPGAAFGYTFSTHALPIADFVRSTHWTRRSALRLLGTLLPSVLVANCFLPASFSRHSLAVDVDGRLRVSGDYDAGLAAAAATVERRLGRAFRRMRAYMLPGTFRLGAAGADAHYAGTLPMRAHPRRTETDRDGAIAALPGVYVADASALPVLPGKAHTLSMMACADRLGRDLAARLRNAS